MRTRVCLADRSDMEEVSKAHAEVFSEIRPANTTVVTEMVDPAWKLEIDVDALLLYVTLLRTRRHTPTPWRRVAARLGQCAGMFLEPVASGAVIGRCGTDPNSRG